MENMQITMPAMRAPPNADAMTSMTLLAVDVAIPLGLQNHEWRDRAIRRFLCHQAVISRA